ncbi:Uncharacterized protein Adt_25908 [Abeliophyllum distichum]|uniref:Uncharacterized protein n=1 Tax=Abeliophyllum distichum TaxID=126358 RepID=A0ABD1RPD9_9LAMI
MSVSSDDAVQETDSNLNIKTSRNSPMKTKEIEESDEKKEEEEKEKEKEEKTLKLWDCGSPLYDSHEVASISHVIERHFMVLPYLSGSRNVKESSLISSSSSIQSEPKKAESSSKVRGFSVVKFLKDILEGNLWKRKKKDKISTSRRQSSSTRKSK